MTQRRTPSSRLAATLALDEPVTRIPGVSTTRQGSLAKLGMRTVRDVLSHYPRRYMDLTCVRTTATAQIGEQCTIKGTVHEVKLKRPRYNLPIVEISIVDDDGVMIVSVFHQPWLKQKLKEGQGIMASGKVEFKYGFMRMTNPFLEVAEGESGGGRIIPIHPASEKLAAPAIRKIVAAALDATFGMHDPVPLPLRLKRGIVSRGCAFSAIHFPKDVGEVDVARTRLVYEELLLLQLFLMKKGDARAVGVEPVRHVVDGDRMRRLADAVPFRLTAGQDDARRDILASMAAPRVANHMLLGDVGTGKTIVAAFGFAAATDSGGQSMLLAPTEVLARQHSKTLGPLLAASGMRHALLTGSTPSADRDDIVERLAEGRIDVVIGTHALLEDDVTAPNLTFVVIDEQQRFGVNQRAKALSKGAAPDALFLTATPIPRSLALALFGNLSLSYLKQRPNEVAARQTTILSNAQKGKAYDGALAELKAGRQAYVVCPLIGVSSEQRDEGAVNKKAVDGGDEAYHPVVAIEEEGDFETDNLTAARDEAEFLQKRVFVDYRVGLLHGGMAPDEKAQVMEAFRAGDIDVLVTTTVIEVGVDVPNATVMIVQDADRFGLSQLHQLRGRVGRGEHAGKVFLVSASKQPQALRRLEALEKSDDGFEIAQYDLSLRREGDILGNRQSGTSALKLVNIMRDSEIIEWANEDARSLLDDDPDLALPEHKGLAREVAAVFKDDHSVLGG